MFEIELLKKLDHPNIIKLYDLYMYKGFYYVVTEYCKGGSVLNIAKVIKTITTRDVLVIMKQLMSAVAYLHENRIVHRDVKLENIVMLNSLEEF